MGLFSGHSNTLWTSCHHHHHCYLKTKSHKHWCNEVDEYIASQQLAKPNTVQGLVERPYANRIDVEKVTQEHSQKSLQNHWWLCKDSTVSYIFCTYIHIYFVRDRKRDWKKGFSRLGGIPIQGTAAWKCDGGWKATWVRLMIHLQNSHSSKRGE